MYMPRGPKVDERIYRNKDGTFTLRHPLPKHKAAHYQTSTLEEAQILRDKLESEATARKAIDTTKRKAKRKASDTAKRPRGVRGPAHDAIGTVHDPGISDADAHDLFMNEIGHIVKDDDEIGDIDEAISIILSGDGEIGHIVNDDDEIGHTVSDDKRVTTLHNWPGF